MSKERIKEHKKDLIDMKKAFRRVVMRTIPILILTPIILNVYFGISIDEAKSGYKKWVELIKIKPNAELKSVMSFESWFFDKI